ncbi:dihydroorotate dehydrogenase [candidate division MSBL1 archaeon SCGC-AAA259I09]|uniref:Dihydroorotate dehydrogenase B (NAD(+)), catalytic subunit n=1 Tax=candidate division MSBL1 archaeon SCGC-AAA259I09 TaxID=1698267 RepID=A0A133UM05_9EURY|nr:dihydroorotate dehydrogenase [candidate division MSBL1 archaeon SCGC-AAA259I09]
MKNPDISVEVCGLRFKNPIVLASATPTKSPEKMLKGMKKGAGGVIAKTVTDEPLLQKYVRPRFTVLHKSGWPQVYSNYSCEYLYPGTPEEWLDELEKTKEYAEKYDSVLIGSVSGRTVEKWAEMARKTEEAGADIIEMNFGCPHPKSGKKMEHKEGTEIGQDPEMAAEITKAVKNETSVPVFAKLTPENTRVEDVTKKVEKAGADGVTAINRFQALDIDIEAEGRPLLHGDYAGVGGPWMRPLTLKYLTRVAKEVDLPISATNGVSTWKDVVKMIMCGATTVQTATAIIYGGKGYDPVEQFNNNLEEFMAEHSYSSIEDMCGVTLDKIIPFEDVEREPDVWSEVVQEECTQCGLCENWCFYNAIQSSEDRVGIEKEKCDGCGLCVSLCPQSAIEMKGETPVYFGDFK